MPDYDDDIAATAREVKALGVRVEALERQQAALIADLAWLKASVTRVAEYQGVKHLLAPQ